MDDDRSEQRDQRPDVPEDSLARRIATAAREMEGRHGAGDTMDAVVGLGLKLVTSAEHCGISLVRAGRRVETPAASGDVPERVDALQYEHGEGPCLDAIRKQEQVHSPDIATDERWPAWGSRTAGEVGIHSMLCFRLFTNDDVVGALNFYASRPDAFAEDDFENGLALAAHSAIAVSAALDVEQLRAGIDSRDLIGQAKGILMERFDFDADRAFAVLSRVSQHTNRKLRDVARELVETRHLPGD